MSSQKPSRSFQGRVNHAQGQLFEGRIEAALRRYQQRGEAVVEKTPEPMRPLQRLEGGRFLAVFEKPAQPDYLDDVLTAKRMGAKFGGNADGPDSQA